MDELEKVEKLREKADVSYDEAREALRACDGDILDALVYLEKQGKVNEKKSTSYSTENEGQAQYEDVSATIEKTKKENEEGFFSKLGKLINKAWKRSNAIHIIATKEEKEMFNIPLWGGILIFLLAWHVAIILMVVSLFFSWRYELKDTEKEEDKFSAFNNVMNHASNAAEKVVDEFSSDNDNQ